MGTKDEGWQFTLYILLHGKGKRWKREGESKLSCHVVEWEVGRVEKRVNFFCCCRCWITIKKNYKYNWDTNWVTQCTQRNGERCCRPSSCDSCPVDWWKKLTELELEYGAAIQYEWIQETERCARYLNLTWTDERTGSRKGTSEKRKFGRMGGTAAFCCLLPAPRCFNRSRIPFIVSLTAPCDGDSNKTDLKMWLEVSVVHQLLEC